MKILSIVGARPQFIKASALSSYIKEVDELEEIVVHTGQHYDANMSDVFFKQMGIDSPKYNLNINGTSHGDMTGEMLKQIESICLVEKPDWLVVYGDTNSTIAGALAASKLNIKVAHIEAGLRSFNMRMPEEVNRILTDRISNVLFCPSPSAVKNLSLEGVEHWGADVVECGDIMYECINKFKDFAVKPTFIDLDSEAFSLCTIHRAENTDCPERIRNLVRGINLVSDKVKVILPLHPRTKKIIRDLGLEFNNTVCITEPVGYFEMLWLLYNCEFVMTDSGGLQKEAYFSRKMCITLRDETEWVELTQIKVNTLVGASVSKLLSAVDNIKTFPNVTDNVYGSADVSKKIVSYLLKGI